MDHHPVILQQRCQPLAVRRALGKWRGYAPGAVAIAWTLLNPAVTGAIVGARTREQVNDVVAAAELHLSSSDLFELQGVAQLAGRGQ